MASQIVCRRIHRIWRFAARVLSQRMANPTDGTEFCLNHAIIYLASYPKGVLMYSGAWPVSP